MILKFFTVLKRAEREALEEVGLPGGMRAGTEVEGLDKMDTEPWLCSLAGSLCVNKRAVSGGVLCCASKHSHEREINFES